MTAHFCAFSFVDRITGFEPGVRARGVFAIPADLEAFPACLVAEAVGQLAAWTAMAHIGFRGRPVAALAHETRFLRGVQPGQLLDLVVEIDDCDDAAVAYHGQASVAGDTVIELHDCLGPMLPVAEFDDPAAMAARLALLTGEGAVPGRFRGVPRLRAQRVASQDPAVAEGLLKVPADAPFFHDHFPRRPVFPATLMLDAQLALASELLTESGRWPAGAPVIPSRMARVKVRSFTPPGAELLLRAALRPDSASGDAISIDLSASADGKTVATARAEFNPGSPA
jgi:3-hydroxymyristoyl/3-hydroxydecanoyl-(acyl carrier protein) dehydratase